MSATVTRASDSRDRFTVGLVQTSCGVDADQNRDAALTGIRSAAAQGAEVVCLQELFASRYFCQTEDTRFFDLAETIPGPSTQACAAVAKELGVVVIAPVFERRASGLYHNSAAVIDVTGELVGLYRKLHIPDDPQYYEKFYFAPGDLGYQVFDTSVARIGVLICWDQWYPEAARLTALQGAEIICYPTAIGWLAADRDDEGLAQIDAWRTIQRSHAIANGVYVAAVNRVGHEGETSKGIEFWGGSFVCDPRGQIVAEAAADRDEVVVVECSRRVLEEQRRAWPFLRDRRIDTYAPIIRRFLDDPADRTRRSPQ
jgi:N-carbamoylputrescine amidase